MDRNSIIGFVLIALVLIGFGVYTQPSEEEQRQAYVQDSIAQAKAQQAQKAAKLAAANKQQAQKEKVLADTTALFHSALTGKAQDIVLQNSKVALTFSTKGATITKAYIKNEKGSKRYVGHNIGDRSGKSDDKMGVTLFQGKDQSLNFTLVAKEMNIATKDLYFQASGVTDSTVTFTATAAAGKTLTLTYRLGQDYLLHMSLQAKGMSGLFDPNASKMNVDWTERVREQERGFTFENRYARLDYKDMDGDQHYLSESSSKQETAEENMMWLAYKNQFFSAMMISKDGFDKNADLQSTVYDKKAQENWKVRYLKEFQSSLKAPFDPSGVKSSDFEFYYGPNDFYVLKNVEKQSAFGHELDMERLVYLGWPLFRYINRWFTLPVFTVMSNNLGFSMGIVLILITLLLKAITYPMVKKSYMSSAKMRVLKPKVDAATAQYNKPEDQMMKQQAMMAEYAKYGASPLSGCLPMLIQMPIWIAMFNFVPNAIQLRGESFLWMNDLSTYDPIFEWGKNLWLIGDHLSLTCILFCASQLIYSWFTMQLQKDQMVGTAEQQQQMKMMLMPLMFFFMFNDYSSGLNFYYFISLILSAFIMWLLRKTTNDEKLLKILEARYKENQSNPKKQKGMMARMQALQQQAMEMQRQQQMQQNRK